MIHAHFFLGANSAGEFYSLYDQLLTAPLRDLGILKGGPGSGKSTLMRRVADAMEQCGQDTVYIHCSGDPNSLDAVLFPALRTGLADGTAPHVLEPRYPAVRERYVDLTPCCNLTAAKELAPELTTCADDYRTAYQNAYHVLRALGSIESERRALAHEGLDRQKLLHRAAGIAAREFKGRGTGTGRTARVFLGGPTCLGMLERFDSAESLCPRIYELHDNYAIAAPMLHFLHRAALEAGEDVLLCPDALHPSEPRHLLIPSRGLAFLTACGRQGCTKAPYRRLRIDAMAEQSLSRTQKAHLRLLRRLHRELEAEAIDALARAKHGHDALELLYRPCMSFAAVDALCDEEISRMCRYID